MPLFHRKVISRLGEEGKKGSERMISILMETLGLNRAVALGTLFFILVLAFLTILWFLRMAPPETLVLSSGPKGSIFFEYYAKKYQKILAHDHVRLKILESHGSLENLKRLNDPIYGVDIGFVQGGVTNGIENPNAVSLGSMAYEPLFVFSRRGNPIHLLSDLAGKRLAIGPKGSGSHALALKLLDENGIKPGGKTTLLELDPDPSGKALWEGKVDAIFLMSDTASWQLMMALLEDKKIRLMDFVQADAYTRKINYLTKMEIPRGGLDFGRDIPAKDIHLIGPTVELLARPDLHPALSDLVLEAAKKIHGKAGLLQKTGEFPAPLQHEFKISPNALSYYKSGKGFLYRYLPFWLASEVNRLWVLVPMLFVMYSALKSIPRLIQLRNNLRIYRWYRVLMAIERELFRDAGRRDELLERLDHIEKAVNKMKVPASTASQFFTLRENIHFVRAQLMKKEADERGH